GVGLLLQPQRCHDALRNRIRAGLFQCRVCPPERLVVVRLLDLDTEPGNLARNRAPVVEGSGGLVMASAITHFVVGASLALPALRSKPIRRAMPAWAIPLSAGLMAVAPDLD